MDAASGEIIIYEDNDDLLGIRHAENIYSCFNETTNWAIFNAFYRLKEVGDTVAIHEASFELDTVNTACFAHRRGLNMRWDVDLDGDPNVGIGENRIPLKWLLKYYPIYKKVGGAAYFINNFSLSNN